MGRPHGRDGSFWVEDADAPLAVGTVVQVGEIEAAIERRDGTDDRPLVRLAGVRDRESAAALRGRSLTVSESEAPLAEDEWLVSDLVGCEVPGLGEVRRVLAGPSCDVLEVGDDGVLIPLVSDAIERVDVGNRRIEVNREFLALDEPPLADGEVSERS